MNWRKTGHAVWADLWDDGWKGTALILGALLVSSALMGIFLGVSGRITKLEALTTAHDHHLNCLQGELSRVRAMAEKLRQWSEHREMLKEAPEPKPAPPSGPYVSSFPLSASKLMTEITETGILRIIPRECPPKNPRPGVIWMEGAERVEALHYYDGKGWCRLLTPTPWPAARWLR